jgi:hypothetical protein
MAGTSVAPDLRLLAVGIMSWFQRRYPEIVLAGDISRVAGATNVLLVSLRVVMQCCKRFGMTDAEVQSIVKAAQPKQTAANLMTPADVDNNAPDRIDGRLEPYRVMWDVDKTLADPKCRARSAKWFVVTLWPAVLKRAATGTMPTEREMEVALAEVSRMRGER